ncbi:sulfotransferase family protein [Allonocardiopsis opalescens]|uniref:Sulfotransferase family protein n=1 Tax=Allonocardiopsis opalescens TaxID=1144618 RepID=A0A2T0PYU2_9ACTN|nr:sulfotransferase [Allonocardiopsis opalescens]PRX96688.1 sulfotransferase family protein [Allonocardiopsis opalescens]
MRARTAWWVGPVNAWLDRRAADARRSPEESFDRIAAAAARREGTAAEAVDPDFVADLRLLHGFVHTDAEVAALGRRAFDGEIGRHLANRLRLDRAEARDPEAAARPVERPVFVVGLPRSGTTLMHRLLAAPSEHRAPLLWELLAPGRPDAGRAELRRRRAAGRLMVAQALSSTPALRDMHPLRADAPEECTHLLPHSSWHCTRARLPEYGAWLARRDFTADYGYLGRQLRVLSGPGPERRWVLKSPFHLCHLEALLSAFPDAVVVWTHRDPARVMASWCSMVEALRGVFTRGADPADLGEEWLRTWSAAVAKAMAVREAAGPARFVDVDYRELTADPAGTAEKVCARIGAVCDGPARHRMAEVARWPGGPRSRHRYSAERYGLDADRVRAAFAPYLAAFGPTA